MVSVDRKWWHPEFSDVSDYWDSSVNPDGRRGTQARMDVWGLRQLHHRGTTMTNRLVTTDIWPKSRRQSNKNRAAVSSQWLTLAGGQKAAAVGEGQHPDRGHEPSGGWIGANQSLRRFLSWCTRASMSTPSVIFTLRFSLLATKPSSGPRTCPTDLPVALWRLSFRPPMARLFPRVRVRSRPTWRACHARICKTDAEALASAEVWSPTNGSKPKAKKPPTRSALVDTAGLCGLGRRGPFTGASRPADRKITAAIDATFSRRRFLLGGSGVEQSTSQRRSCR